MFLRLFHPFLFLTVVDGAGGGSGGGEAAPAAAPAPAPAAPAAPADGGAPAVPPAGEPVARPQWLTDPAADPAALIADDAPYRDVVPFREELADARAKYGPVAQALEGLPAEVRDAYVRFAPAQALSGLDATIAPDLALVQATYPTMHPDDQATINGILARAHTDPAGTIDALRQAADVFRGDPAASGPAAPGAPGIPGQVDEWGYALDDPNRPVTAAEFAAQQSTFREELVREQAIATYQQEYAAKMTADLRDLGYDPTSTDPVEKTRARLVLDLMQQTPDGTLQQAHEALVARDQRMFDQYVQGRAPDGVVRPQPPTGGASPSGERVLGTLAEMDQAAAERARQVAAAHRSQ